MEKAVARERPLCGTCVRLPAVPEFLAAVAAIKDATNFTLNVLNSQTYSTCG